MKRLLSVLVVLAVGLGAGSAAQAQQTGRAPADSTQQRRAGVSPQVVRGGGSSSAPASVQQVRRRIRSIGGGGGTVQRVIYPLIVVPSVTVSSSSELEVPPGYGVAPQAAPDYRSPYVPRRSRDDYYDPYYRSRLRDYDDYSDDPERIRIRRRGEGGDSLAVMDSVATDSMATDSLRQRPPQPPPPPRRERPVTVRQVERAILETGLFRAIGVNFEFNQEQLLPEARLTLEQIGTVIERYPDLRVQIAGHTDNVGSEAYNQRLSEQRAAAVGRYLVNNFGISEDRLEGVGYGESDPIASNATATGRTLNRRVEFRVLNPEAAEQYREEQFMETPDGRRQRRPGDGGNVEEELRDLIRDELRQSRQAAPDTTGGP